MLLVFGSTAKEFIHLFAGHHDTEHVQHASAGELYFENEHHHCTFLSFALPDFYHDASVSFFEAQAVEYVSHVSFSGGGLPEMARFATSTRGPPEAV